MHPLGRGHLKSLSSFLPRFSGIEADPIEPNPYDPAGEKSDYFLDSHFFRDPVAFKAISREIKTRFAHVQPNLMVHGCSDGSDAYALAITLQESTYAHPVKILAKDLSKTLIDQNQSGHYEMLDLDKKNFQHFSAQKPLTHYYDDQRECFKPPVRQAVKFAPGDILEDTVRPLPAHTVLMFRNAVYWLPLQQRTKLALQLSQAMQPGSLLVLGEIPEDQAFAEVLCQVGFRSVQGHTLLEKVSTPSVQQAQATLQNSQNQSALAKGQEGPLGLF